MPTNTHSLGCRASFTNLQRPRLVFCGNQPLRQLMLSKLIGRDRSSWRCLDDRDRNDEQEVETIERTVAIIVNLYLAS